MRNVCPVMYIMDLGKYEIRRAQLASDVDDRLWQNRRVDQADRTESRWGSGGEIWYSRAHIYNRLGWAVERALTHDNDPVGLS